MLPAAAVGPATISQRGSRARRDLYQLRQSDPRDFAYQVYRRATGSKTWEEKALISAENQFDRFFNKVKEANAHNPVYEFPADSIKMAIWGISINTAIVIPFPLRYAAHVSRSAWLTWYDDTAEKGKQYEYKVVMLKANQKPMEQLVPSIKYPSARKTDYLIQTKEYEAKDERVNIAYTIGDRQDMYAAKIFRSYYLQSDFAPLTESIGFIGNDDGSFEAIAADKTVLKKVSCCTTYSPTTCMEIPGTPPILFVLLT